MAFLLRTFEFRVCSFQTGLASEYEPLKAFSTGMAFFCSFFRFGIWKDSCGANSFDNGGIRPLPKKELYIYIYIKKQQKSCHGAMDMAFLQSGF